MKGEIQMPLPYDTESICPECFQVIPAVVKEEDGKVIMEKKCETHGFFKDTYWSSVDQFLRVEKYWYTGHFDNPRTEAEKGCPNDCGLCTSHKSHTCLGLIDVTNRCNLACPICFANAAASGYVYEPDIETIREILINLRENRPTPCPAVQFAGGEPTVREDLPEIIKIAREVGFPHIEIASNVVRIAKDIEYTKKLYEAGLGTIYMQFDGVTPEPYIPARGVNLLPIKKQALENCREVGLHSIVLVPTLVKGINDDQVGDIIRFAVENIDIVSGIIFQPVSITGRIDREKLEEMRITVPDFMLLCEEQTDGKIKVDDYFPCSTVAPLARAISLYTDRPAVEFSCSPHCGMATYVFVDDGKYHPITEFINIDGFIGTAKNIVKDFEKGGRLNKLKSKFRMIGAIRHFRKKRSKMFRDLLKGVVSEGSFSKLGDFHRNSILIGSMHFMDPYNFDLKRVERCVIHYGVPGGKIIPFCAMNSIHRPKIEKEFSIPLEEWKRRRKEEKIEITAIVE